MTKKLSVSTSFANFGCLRKGRNEFSRNLKQDWARDCNRALWSVDLEQDVWSWWGSWDSYSLAHWFFVSGRKINYRCANVKFLRRKDCNKSSFRHFIKHVSSWICSGCVWNGIVKLGFGVWGLLSWAFDPRDYKTLTAHFFHHLIGSLEF